ncbi:MAG: DNA mismatch repair protein MutS [Desulfovibrio sp.]|nr:DNA mismatch repair protein MutS [Desulfovibrio sp.]
MFEQYMRIKADYQDALLFYRMGDFYELFFDDAVTASRELQIALTSRNKSAGNDVPMCGVPWHASQSYIAQLIDKGYVVAICEQTEDPKDPKRKGLVQRAVTQIITPGTVLDSDNLQAEHHNYLGCVLSGKAKSSDCLWAFVWADISTGQWTGTEFHREEDLWQWVQKMGPRELLLEQSTIPPKLRFLESVHLVRLNNQLSSENTNEILCQAQHVRSLDALGLKKKPTLAQACAQLLRYIEQMQKTSIDQLEAFAPLNLSRRMLIDDTSERNLELFTTLSGSKGKGTLHHLLKNTITPMGARKLEDLLHHPWREEEPILQIQSAVRFLAEDDCLRRDLRQALQGVFDLERLCQRICLNRCHPKDFINLRASLQALPTIKSLLTEANASHPLPLMTKLLDGFDCLEDLATLLARALVDDPPQLITEGGLFRQGYHEELDQLLDMVDNAQQKLEELLAKERESSGLSKLKLGYNRVFGYYYELSRTAAQAIPAHFTRRQSLANTERFTTEALKTLEEALLSASDKRKSLEFRLFQQLREHLGSQRERLLPLAEMLGEIDYWQSLAQVGRSQGWVFPTFSHEPVIDLCGGRHPVIENIVGRTNFVPNDLSLGQSHSFCLLTGPNMAGKSTILRQTALICLLAQMGSMVPATSARLGLVDKLFSRVGAQDNLAQGESTFMVEMMETARILRQSSLHSLVILDEIGRGTSTYDGVALAWAIVEYLVARSEGKTRTLFATHYHELTELEGRLPEVFTMNVAIREVNGSIVFLHKLIPGPADKSYGVEVAHLAGIPKGVVDRARELLRRLESGRKGMQEAVRKTAQALLPGLESHFSQAKAQTSTASHPLQKALCDLDPERLSPMEALNLLMDWKRRWGSKKSRENV